MVPLAAASLVLASLIAGPGPAGAPPAASARILQPPGAIPAEATGASGRLDPVAATTAYLATVPTAARTRSDAYFEGGYWLQLWDFLASCVVFVLLLQTGLSARMRDLAGLITRLEALRSALYWVQFLVIFTLATLPLTLYEGFFREHQYGMSNLTLGGFLGEQAKALGLGCVFGGLAVSALYAVLRRLRTSGSLAWLWATLVMVAFIAFGSMIAPVVVTPVFNKPTRLQDARVVAPILSLARANGIQADSVWEIDASKQTRRVSANVSGFLGTQRITLNDNLLNRASLPEIEDVMGHEMGHYVLNHIPKSLVFFGVLIAIGFAAIQAGFERLRLRGRGWGVTGLGDVAGLPLVALLFTTYLTLLTPVLNTIIRTQEQEADVFGLNAARKPDGHAQVALKLAEYRKLSPGPLEELVFFDHPSGRTRILTAMRWKAEHPELWQPPAGSPPATAPKAELQR